MLHSFLSYNFHICFLECSQFQRNNMLEYSLACIKIIHYYKRTYFFCIANEIQKLSKYHYHISFTIKEGANCE